MAASAALSLQTWPRYHFRTEGELTNCIDRDKLRRGRHGTGSNIVTQQWVPTGIGGGVVGVHVVFLCGRSGGGGDCREAIAAPLCPFAVVGYHHNIIG